jgi:hypothetical protein
MLVIFQNSKFWGMTGWLANEGGGGGGGQTAAQRRRGAK